jgi:hypothetical protein
MAGNKGVSESGRRRRSCGGCRLARSTADEVFTLKKRPPRFLRTLLELIFPQLQADKAAVERIYWRRFKLPDEQFQSVLRRLAGSVEMARGSISRRRAHAHVHAHVHAQEVRECRFLLCAARPPRRATHSSYLPT